MMLRLTLTALMLNLIHFLFGMEEFYSISNGPKEFQRCCGGVASNHSDGRQHFDKSVCGEAL